MTILMLPALASLVLPVQDPGGAPSEHLKPLGFLIGTWTSSGNLESGEAYTDEQRFELMHNGNFIKNEYSLKVSGQVRWTSTSIIGYDPEKKKLVAFAFAGNGAIARTECAPGERKDRWIFEGRVGAQEERVTHAKVDEDAFSITVELKKDGKFTAQGSYVYKRKK